MAPSLGETALLPNYDLCPKVRITDIVHQMCPRDCRADLRSFRLDADEEDDPADEAHVDVAARYTHFFGDWDVGAYYFYGTGPELGASTGPEQLSILTGLSKTNVRRAGLPHRSPGGASRDLRPRFRRVWPGGSVFVER